MNKTKTCTRLSALFAVLLAIMIAVPAILQSGADAAVNKKQPTKATLTSAKATSYNKVSLKWKKSKNITSYAVYYKASNSKKWVKITNVSSKKTGYTHKSSKKYPLKQGKTYQYRIRGYNKKAKGRKKWGKYSSVKKVKIPKKSAAKPTEAPKPIVTPNPTATPKPTAVPKPTAAPKPTVTPIPKPTAIPKPTTIPKPTAIPKPTEAPKPTAAPQPTKAPRPTATPKPTATPRPTATPAPTATPKPVKVSSITLNQTSLTLTSKGQTASLTATVSPANAANKSLTWSSSDSSVVTVNANGTVTAVANGTADITATAADGSGVSAKCSVTVKVPNNVRSITLDGGESIDIGPDRDDINSIDFSKVTFNIQNNNGSLDVLGFSSNLYSASVCVRALKVGNTTIIAKYNGNVLLTYNVTVSSDWQEYLEYVTWRKSIENKIWSSGMSVVNKLDAAKNFIQSHYGYQHGAGAIINVYNGAILDCYGATELMSDFAKDIGLSIKYVNAISGHIFDYSVYAFSEGGHVYPKILINGNWVNYDATPTHS